MHIYVCILCAGAMKLLPDHVGTSETADPDLMDLAGVDINDVAHAVGLLLWVLVPREHDRELARQDHVRGQAVVGVRRVVRVAGRDCQSARAHRVECSFQNFGYGI